MISIKKFVFFVIITALFLVSAGAETRKMSWSISPTLGFLYGHAEELVYKFPDRDLYLSELLWDLKPLFYIGLAADYGPNDPFKHGGFTAALSIKYGLPLKTGVIENRDWVNYEHNYLTHFSTHDLYSRGAFFFDISAGYSWQLSNNLAFLAYGEFTFKHLFWSGWNGYYQYSPGGAFAPPWNDTLPKVELNGEVIRYIQNWFILAPGFSLNWKPHPLFSFSGSFSYSPLIYCRARDDHLVPPARTFHDYLYFGHYFKGNGELIFSTTENIDLSLNLSYTHISGTRGDTRTSGIIIRQIAGAGYSAFGLGLAARIRLSGRD
jgi:outer membrane protease